MKTLVTLFLSLIMTVTLTGCDSDEPSQNFYFTEIATLDEVNDSGSLFTLYTAQGESVRLDLPYHLNPEIVSPGQRVILTFASSSTEPFTPGTTLQLISYRKVSTLKLGTTTAENPLLNALPINLQSAWLTGPWLNIRAMIPYLPDNVIIDIVTKEGDTSENRDIYMIMSLVEAKPTHERETYYSVSLDQLLQSDNAPTSITLHVYSPENATVEHITLPIQ